MNFVWFIFTSQIIFTLSHYKPNKKRLHDLNFILVLQITPMYDELKNKFSDEVLETRNHQLWAAKERDRVICIKIVGKNLF